MVHSNVRTKYDYDISDSRHLVTLCPRDVADSLRGPVAGEDKPGVNDLSITPDVVPGDTRNLRVVEVVVDMVTENTL